MDRKDRAKQFLPYDSLKGLREALLKKEKEIEEKDDKILHQSNVVEQDEE